MDSAMKVGSEDTFNQGFSIQDGYSNSVNNYLHENNKKTKQYQFYLRFKI